MYREGLSMRWKNIAQNYLICQSNQLLWYVLYFAWLSTCYVCQVVLFVLAYIGIQRRTVRAELSNNVMVCFCSCVALCSGHGSPAPGSGGCSCHPGWTGPNCNICKQFGWQFKKKLCWCKNYCKYKAKNKIIKARGRNFQFHLTVFYLKYLL